MKNFLLLFSILILVNCLKAQFPPCAPQLYGTSAGNEPPGCFLCVGWYSGSTEGYDSTTFWNLNFPCGTIENNQFLAFMADTSGILDFKIIADSCANEKGLEYVVLDRFRNLISDCFLALPSDNSSQFIVPNLTPGEIYLIMIDGISGDECAFQLKISSGSTRNEILPIILNQTPNFSITGDKVDFCIDEEICFNVISVPHSSTHLNWVIDTSGGTEISNGDLLDGRDICLKFKTAGEKFIAARSIFGCYDGIATSRRFSVVTPLGNLNKVVCPGEEFIIGDSIFSLAGIYEVVLKNASSGGCDSTVILDLKIPDTSAFSVSCFPDSFLNALTINWDEKPLADGYEIFINGDFVSRQNFRGYILQDPKPGQTLEIEILPKGNHGCAYSLGRTACLPPDFSNSEEIFLENDVRIFPNPSNGDFKIKAPEIPQKIEIFDFTGRYLETLFTSEFSLSDYDASVYFFKIYFSKSVIYKKVLRN